MLNWLAPLEIREIAPAGWSVLHLQFSYYYIFLLLSIYDNLN